MASHRQYTDDEIAGALATLQANGGNAKRTAKTLGVARTTLRQWAGRAQSTTAHPKRVSDGLVLERSERLATKFEDFATQAMDAAPDRIGAMSGKDLLIAAGIATEKVQLLRGQPTSRNVQAQIVYVQAAALKSLSSGVLEGEFEADEPA